MDWNPFQDILRPLAFINSKSHLTRCLVVDDWDIEAGMNQMDFLLKPKKLKSIRSWDTNWDIPSSSSLRSAVRWSFINRFRWLPASVKSVEFLESNKLPKSTKGRFWEDVGVFCKIKIEIWLKLIELTTCCDDVCERSSDIWKLWRLDRSSSNNFSSSKSLKKV